MDLNNRLMLHLCSATSEPKGPVYLWARRETTEEDVDASVFNDDLKVQKWPAIQGGGLPAPGSLLRDVAK